MDNWERNAKRHGSRQGPFGTDTWAILEISDWERRQLPVPEPKMQDSALICLHLTLDAASNGTSMK